MLQPHARLTHLEMHHPDAGFLPRDTFLSGHSCELTGASVTRVLSWPRVETRPGGKGEETLKLMKTHEDRCQRAL